MRNLSRRKRIIIVSGVGAVVAIVLMLATGTDESRHKIINYDQFAVTSTPLAPETSRA